MNVKPKKHLGQHFLKDKNIAEKIVNLISLHQEYNIVLEIGAGTGVLTDFLIQREEYDTFVLDIDKESIVYLMEHYPQLQAKQRIIEADFLSLDLQRITKEPLGIIGNFPYNISSQIFFKILNHRNQVKEVVCMLQREVAQRIASQPGSKVYGILSVLLQAFYTIEYCFTVNENVFNPPPKVKSGVIRLKRNDRLQLPCDESLFFSAVKQGFNQRRKTLRNALKGLSLPPEAYQHPIFDKRAEQLSVEDFIFIAQQGNKLAI